MNIDWTKLEHAAIIVSLIDGLIILFKGAQIIWRNHPTIYVIMKTIGQWTFLTFLVGTPSAFLNAVGFLAIITQSQDVFTLGNLFSTVLITPFVVISIPATISVMMAKSEKQVINIAGLIALVFSVIYFGIGLDGFESIKNISTLFPVILLILLVVGMGIIHAAFALILYSKLREKGWFNYHNVGESRLGG